MFRRECGSGGGGVSSRGGDVDRTAAAEVDAILCGAAGALQRSAPFVLVGMICWSLGRGGKHGSVLWPFL